MVFWTNPKISILATDSIFAPLIENSIFCPKPICLKFNLCVDTPVVGLGAKKKSCEIFIFSLIIHHNRFNKRFPPVLDWKGVPSQYRHQQVPALLGLDHLLLLRGYVATTGKYMFIFCFCKSTKSFGLLKFQN